MTDTLEKMGFHPSFNRLISNFLSQHRTTFQLGDFRSEPKQLTIGLPQGSPLSVILYILYNTSLLRQVEGTKESIAMGFIDDVAFLTARRTQDKVTSLLRALADKELCWGKKHRAAFDKQKSQWIMLTHRQAPSVAPTITLGDVTMTPQAQVKWLGVIIHPKITVTSHIKSRAA